MTDIITTLAVIGIDLGDKDARYACLNEEGKFTEEGCQCASAFQSRHFEVDPSLGVFCHI